jgi:hypothetical protein
VKRNFRLNGQDILDPEKVKDDSEAWIFSVSKFVPLADGYKFEPIAAMQTRLELLKWLVPRFLSFRERQTTMATKRNRIDRAFCPCGADIDLHPGKKPCRVVNQMAIKDEHYKYFFLVFAVLYAVGSNTTMAITICLALYN